jgi:hypothetical protein
MILNSADRSWQSAELMIVNPPDYGSGSLFVFGNVGQGQLRLKDLNECTRSFEHALLTLSEGTSTFILESRTNDFMESKLFELKIEVASPKH